MVRCECGSFAINPHTHGRDGKDTHLCDVCYWRKRADPVFARSTGRSAKKKKEADDMSEFERYKRMNRGD